MSHALFPAWRPDAGGRESLAAIAAKLQAAQPPDGRRLQPRRPDQWHATLCFIGYEARQAATPALLDAFAAVARRIPAHGFKVQRVAYWAQSGAVVALPHASPALQALCDATRDAIRQCGIRPEQATTQPHVTLAHLPRGLPAQAWLDDIDCGGDVMRVDRFELLLNPGGHYEALADWPLTGGPLPVAPEQPRLL